MPAERIPRGSQSDPSHNHRNASDGIRIPQHGGAPQRERRVIQLLWIRWGKCRLNIPLMLSALLQASLTILAFNDHSARAGAELPEAVIYSAHRGIDLGDPARPPQRDFYVNVGTQAGLKVGSRVEAVRRLPTYDQIQSQLHADVEVPIAVLRVFHVELHTAICRLEKLLPAERLAAVSPAAVIVGDYVRPLSRETRDWINAGADERIAQSTVSQSGPIVSPFPNLAPTAPITTAAMPAKPTQPTQPEPLPAQPIIPSTTQSPPPLKSASVPPPLAGTPKSPQAGLPQSPRPNG